VQIGRDLTNLLNLTDKEAQKRGDQFIASEMFLLAACEDKGETGRLPKQHGLDRKIAGKGDRMPCAAGRASIRRKPKDQREALKKYCIDLTERAAAGQARPGDRPRR
jgi:ATP-dependent Clp protease ATP-binding subunit ClpB